MWQFPLNKTAPADGQPVSTCKGWASKANTFHKLWSKAERTVSSFPLLLLREKLAPSLRSAFVLCVGYQEPIQIFSQSSLQAVNKLFAYRIWIPIQKCDSYLTLTSLLNLSTDIRCLLCHSAEFRRDPLAFSLTSFSTHAHQNISKSWCWEFPAQIKCKRLVLKGKELNCSQASV